MTVSDLGGQSSAWYFDPSVRIDDLVLLDAGRSASVPVVDSGADVLVKGDIFRGTDISGAMRLFIERGDGLRVGKSRFSGAIPKGSHAVEARLSPIGLLPGRHRVDVEILAQYKVCAQRWQVFNVSNSTVFGGNPAYALSHACAEHQAHGKQRPANVTLAASE